MSMHDKHQKDKAHDLHREAFKLAANFIYHPDKKILHLELFSIGDGRVQAFREKEQ